MKIVSEKKKAEVIVENQEVVEITVLNNKNMKIVIKCLGETLHIEESVDVINDKLEEELAIKAMDKYLKKHKNYRK